MGWFHCLPHTNTIDVAKGWETNLKAVAANTNDGSTPVLISNLLPIPKTVANLPKDAQADLNLDIGEGARGEDEVGQS